MTMNKLALIALLLCFASLADAALKDCRVYVKNSTPVPLVVQGEREAPEVIKPGETKSFATNRRTTVWVSRWCPSSAAGGVYRQLVRVIGENPTAGYPTIQADIPSDPTVWTKLFKLSENEGVDCSAWRNGYGFAARCWRAGDSSDKNMFMELTQFPSGCKDGVCDGLDQTVVDLCNA